MSVVPSCGPPKTGPPPRLARVLAAVCARTGAHLVPNCLAQPIIEDYQLAVVSPCPDAEYR